MSETDEFEKAWAIYEPPFGASPKQISSHFYTLGSAAATRAGTENGRTVWDAVAETDKLLDELFDAFHPGGNEWFFTRLTKIREALSDRPAAPVGEDAAGGDVWEKIIEVSNIALEQIPEAHTATAFRCIRDIASELQRRGA